MMQKLTQEDWERMAESGMLFSQGDYERALAALSSIRPHTMDPHELATILFGEAQCYRLLRTFEHAHTSCDRALELSKGDNEATVTGWIIKADILVDEGRSSDALSVIESSLRRYPTIERNQLLLRKAEHIASQGEHVEAIAILSRLLESCEFDEQDIATIHHKLGISHGALGQLDEAARHLLEAQSQALSEGYASNNSFWLAHIAAKRRDFLTAKNHLLDALARAEQSRVDVLADVYESLANVSREVGDDSNAAKYDSLWRSSKRSD